MNKLIIAQKIFYEKYFIFWQKNNPLLERIIFF